MNPSCDKIDVINEGILLSVALTDFTDNIRFYYINEKTKNEPHRIPHVNFITSDHQLLQIYYSDENNFTVPGTFDAGIGLLNYTVNMSQFIYEPICVTDLETASIC